MSDVTGLCLEMQFTSIDVRHEQAAAIMGHVYSRLTGTPGIGFAASGPGTTNSLTGIGNSFLDATPLTPANLLILYILYRTNMYTQRVNPPSAESWEQMAFFTLDGYERSAVL